MFCCLKEEMWEWWIQVLPWKQEEVGPESGRAWRLISPRQFLHLNGLVFHFRDLFLSMCTNKAGVRTGSGQPHTGKKGAGLHTMSSICEGGVLWELVSSLLTTWTPHFPSFSANSSGSLTAAWLLHPGFPSDTPPTTMALDVCPASAEHGHLPPANCPSHDTPFVLGLGLFISLTLRGRSYNPLIYSVWIEMFKFALNHISWTSAYLWSSVGRRHNRWR